jgi:DNA-binding cell septation regulator SpoVG
MDITRIGLRRAERPGPIKALGYAVLDNAWKLNGIRVVEEPHGHLWVRFPQQQTRAGELKDVYRPLTPHDRAAIDAAVLGAYAQLRDQPDADLITYRPPRAAVAARRAAASQEAH